MESCEYELSTGSPTATERVAFRLGGMLAGGEVVALVGELGAGKTTFTRGLVAGLGGRADHVHSPTYVLEAVYGARLEVRHYDVYRLGSSGEFLDLGVEDEIAASKVVVVEWADRVDDVLPADALRIELHASAEEPDARRLVFRGAAELWRDRLARLIA